MKKTGVGLLAVMVAVALLFSGGLDSVLAKTYLFKYANTQTENHPRSKSMVFFKNMLEKASGGRIQVVT